MVSFRFIKQILLNKFKQFPTLCGLIMLLVFAGIFVFQNENNGFEHGHRGYLSAHGMALAQHVTYKMHFFTYSCKSLDDKNRVIYDAYNRFPFIPFYLIRQVIYPYRGDFIGQIHAARRLMNLFFCLSITISFFILRRLTGNPFLSLAAVLIAFSAEPIQRYQDMIFNDPMALAGFLMAVYIAVRWEERPGPRRRFLFLLAPVSCFMGWQSLGVYFVWFLSDIMEDLLRIFKRRTFNLRLLFGKFSVTAFFSAGCWCAGLLGFQLWNETIYTHKSFFALESINSLAYRLGLAGRTLSWIDYLYRFAGVELEYLFRMTVPAKSILPIIIVLLLWNSIRQMRTRPSTDMPGFSTEKPSTDKLGAPPGLTWKIISVLALSGYAWHLPMNNFVIVHDFQAIFLVGVTLAFYLAIFLCLPSRLYKPLCVALAFYFILQTASMNHEKDLQSLKINSVSREFNRIVNRLPPQSKVAVELSGQERRKYGDYAEKYYLSGHFLVPLKKAGYAVSKEPIPNWKKITNNKIFNLYEK